MLLLKAETCGFIYVNHSRRRALKSTRSLAEHLNGEKESTKKNTLSPFPTLERAPFMETKTPKKRTTSGYTSDIPGSSYGTVSSETRPRTFTLQHAMVDHRTFMGPGFVTCRCNDDRGNVSSARMAVLLVLKSLVKVAGRLGSI